MRIGVWGLCFFIVGYVLVRKELSRGASLAIDAAMAGHVGPGVPASTGDGEEENLPGRGAVLAGLAEEEAHLLEGLAEGVLGRHRGRRLALTVVRFVGGGCGRRVVRTIGVDLIGELED